MKPREKKRKAASSKEKGRKDHAHAGVGRRGTVSGSGGPRFPPINVPGRYFPYSFRNSD